jgi:hypothetical protein
MANYPDRCQHLKVNGTQCGSPALRRNRFCFFHKRFQDERIRLSADRARRGVATFILPVLEDANSIQIALMQVMRLLLSQQIDHKTASLMLYALQTASTNLRMTNFKPRVHDVILHPADAVNTPLESHVWDDEDFEVEDEGEEEQDEVDESAAKAAAAAAEAKARAREEHEIRLRDWASDRPEIELVRIDGTLTIRPRVPAPSWKKPAATSSAVEIRTEISNMVRKELIPALAEKYLPGSEGNQPAQEAEKKAT